MILKPGDDAALLPALEVIANTRVISATMLHTRLEEYGVEIIFSFQAIVPLRVGLLYPLFYSAYCWPGGFGSPSVNILLKLVFI